MSRRTSPPTPDVANTQVPRYRDRILDQVRNDPYEVSEKRVKSPRCGECGAVYQRGRWTWSPPPEDVHETHCPACRRTHDNLPAGLVILEGVHAPALRAEMLRLAQHQAERERSEHPMHRIMRVVERDDGIELATTDIHLPQRIGRAIKRAFHGELEIRYGEAEYTVRVTWHA